MTRAIEERYNALAGESCCLSCGGAFSLSEPAAGESCIDLGCGQGLDLVRLAEAVGPDGVVYGVDVAEAMLSRARLTADKLGIPNIRLVRSELERIALPDMAADLLISNCTINHATDKRAVWAEVYRLLRPRGRFVVSDIYALEPVPDEFRTDPVAVAECWAGAVTREEYLDTLIDTGFSELKVLEESAPYDKGRIRVASFTVAGRRPGGGCGCCGCG